MFFQLRIPPVQFPCSCIPVGNSSCKFYLHWGKHSQAQKKSQQSTSRLDFNVDALANVSPNVNRICNWNLQLECNWNVTAGNCTGEYATGKTQENSRASRLPVAKTEGDMTWEQTDKHRQPRAHLGCSTARARAYKRQRGHDMETETSADEHGRYL